MRILLVPQNDWMTHPNPMRHHFLVKRLAHTHACQIYVLNFDGLGGPRTAMNPELVVDRNICLVGQNSLPGRNPALYYVLNSKHISDLVLHAIRDLKVEVVLNSNVLPSAIATNLAHRMNIPLVYDFVEYYPQSASAYFKNPLAKAVASGIVQKLMNYIIRGSSTVVTVSDSHAKLVRKIDPTKPVHVVPNGVDLRMLSHADLNRPIRHRKAGARELSLVYVGSVDEWVDLEVVLSAVGKLNHEGYRICLKVVGGSHGGFYLDRLKSIVACSDFRRDVQFTGFVPYHLVPQYLRNADVALAPYKKSIKNDVTPLKILEYLACRKIVLCTPLPEIKRRFGDFLWFYDDAEDLARLLRLVSSDRPFMEEKLKHADRILADYSWDKLADRYYQIIESAVVNR